MAITTAQTTTTLRRREVGGDAKLALAPQEPEYPDIQTIRDAIPPHCFQPSAVRSLGYLVRDSVLIAGLGWAALTYIPQIENTAWRLAVWMVYGYVQGLFCTGLWILGHEAGHGAFSLHQQLNNVVGWAAHSALLVPFFSWKFSHHRHHRFTGHMEKVSHPPHPRRGWRRSNFG